MSPYKKLLKTISILSLVSTVGLAPQSYAVGGVASVAGPKNDVAGMQGLLGIGLGGVGLLGGAITGIVGIWVAPVLPIAAGVGAISGLLLDESAQAVVKAPNLTPELAQAWGISAEQLAQYNEERAFLDSVAETMQEQVLLGATIRDGVRHFDEQSLAAAAQTWAAAKQGLSVESVQVLEVVSRHVEESMRAQLDE